MTDARPRSPFLSLPSTAQGRKAVRFFAGAVALAVFGLLMSGLWFGLWEEPGGDQESPPVWLQVPMVMAVLAGGISAVTGGVFALLALRRGDRSAILVLPLIALLFALTFVVGEFAVPH